ncbi:MAG: hypothetical protein AAFY08_08030 [Planctomycetota bacterium]
MNEPIARDSTDQHLDLLGVFNYIVAGIAALIGCFPLLHVAMGLVFLFVDFPDDQPPPPPFFPWIFILFPFCFILPAWAIAVLSLICGRRIKARRRYQFCFVTSGIQCLFMPFGTVLGVFSIIVLSRPEAKARFDGVPAAG